ncbi:hypothetical protein K435DRAFT_971149 [Dendrothele bispora CBS 962.96]|uniref:Uncharacterized protein n=1 Tax=Dendrothele bispora (strain CBS 962.96) TaxID=1314807 RepID=A0A4S8L7D6_DENBC|nr:hypothetical protein K435DRAFT_971149 [Dendrothele bispora CBS 962.96]
MTKSHPAELTIPDAAVKIFADKEKEGTTNSDQSQVVPSFLQLAPSSSNNDFSHSRSAKAMPSTATGSNLQMEKANRMDTLSWLLAAVNSMDNNANILVEPIAKQRDNNPTHAHQPPHVPNSLAPNNVPPRSGPTPNAPFHTPMGKPTFPFNPNSQQNPASGSGPSGNLPNPHGGPPVPMMTFNIPPRDKSRLEGVWYLQNSCRS